jgi:hypothetical protein
MLRLSVELFNRKLTYDLGAARAQARSRSRHASGYRWNSLRLAAHRIGGHGHPWPASHPRTVGRPSHRQARPPPASFSPGFSREGQPSVAPAATIIPGRPQPRSRPERRPSVAPPGAIPSRQPQPMVQPRTSAVGRNTRRDPSRRPQPRVQPRTSVVRRTAGRDPSQPQPAGPALNLSGLRRRPTAPSPLACFRPARAPWR